MLEFNEEKHEYTLEGKRVYSVTQILDVLGGYDGIPAYILNEAADRGTAVHKACELYDLGILDWSTVSDEIIPYLIGYMKFLDDKKPEIIVVERKNFHPTLKYAGTMDRGFILDGVKSIVDLKSSFKLMPATAPQVAAYMEMENAHIKEKKEQYKKRYGLKLTKEGTYELKEYKAATDFNVFLSCFNVLKFKLENNMTKKG